MLAIYLEAFLSRNGFHINGDQTTKGYSNFRYRPFTLEGNFAAGQAVHEMLLQSWGGVLRVFPATPAKWKDVSFADLRAEGGYRDTAERRGGRTVRVRIAAGRDGRLRLRDPFGGEAVTWSRKVDAVGGHSDCTLRAGDVLDADQNSPPLRSGLWGDSLANKRRRGRNPPEPRPQGRGTPAMDATPEWGQILISD